MRDFIESSFAASAPSREVYRASASRWCKCRTLTAIGVDGVRTVEREQKTCALTKITSVTVGVNSEGPPGSGGRTGDAGYYGYLTRVAGSDVRTLSYWTGRDPTTTAAIDASVIRKNRDPGNLGIEPIPGIEPTVMK